LWLFCLSEEKWTLPGAILQIGTKPIQAEPSQTKKNQRNGAWILLDSFVRFGAFQWVTSDSKEKIFRPRTRKRTRCSHSATGVERRFARNFGASLSMPASLSRFPPRRRRKTECHKLGKTSRTKQEHSNAPARRSGR